MAGRSRSDPPTEMAPGSQNAREFLGRLETVRSPEELQKYKRSFKTGPGEYGEGDVFMGVRMGQVFALAKEFADMDLAGIEALLDERFREPNAGAGRIMVTQARERRSAILATMAFIRDAEVDDTFRIAEVLLADEHDLIHKAVGWALRAAGDRDRPRLRAFLDRHAATMPRTTLRYALEHFEDPERARSLGRRKVATA